MSFKTTIQVRYTQSKTTVDREFTFDNQRDMQIARTGRWSITADGKLRWLPDGESMYKSFPVLVMGLSAHTHRVDKDNQFDFRMEAFRTDLTKQPTEPLRPYQQMPVCINTMAGVTNKVSPNDNNQRRYLELTTLLGFTHDQAVEMMTDPKFK